MRSLYARLVLWLIRPALELGARRAAQVHDRQAVHAILRDLRQNGPVARAIRAAQAGSGRLSESDRG